MAGRLIALLMLAILIAGCARIFAVHRRRAASSGVILRSTDIFTRFPSDPATELERELRASATRAVFKWFGLWLALAFMLGFLVTPMLRSAHAALGPWEFAQAIRNSVGCPYVAG